MPGAWELMANKQVLCAILHTEHVTVPWSFGLRRLQVPGPVIGLCGMPFDMARNQAVMQCLQGGFSYVFFLDSDVICPPDTIYRLMSRNLPIISGVYCRRSPPHAIPVMLKNGQWIMPDKLPLNTIIEVDMVGAGCLLIHRSVLESLPPQKPGKHWFNWQVDLKGLNLEPDNMCTSEDFTFNQWAKKHGFPTYVDTSIMCKHIGLAEAGLGTFNPPEAFAA